ncbi:MAG: histidine kinase [Pedobacter sp.]|nr:histidine kinase [Pedobacter sp.]
MSIIKSGLSILLLLCTATAQAQKMSRLEEVGQIPLKIEAEGFLVKKLDTEGLVEKSGFFYNPIGEHRKNKIQSMVYAGKRVRLGIIEDEAELTRPSDYYYRVFNSKGADATYSVNPELGKIGNKQKEEILKTSATLIDTTLSISDYLFVDFYDTKTDTLIKSYYLKRLRIYPKLAKHQKNWKLYKPDTTITIEFENKDKLPQDVLEYRLIRARDTSEWKTDGFTLRFDYLKTNSYYQVEARYSYQPQNIERVSFRVGPEWYEQSWFYLLIIAFIPLIQTLRSRASKAAARRKEEALQQKLRVVQSQLNPHFIFNSLSSIQSMINTGRIDEANDYLSEFSTLMRSTLNGSDKIYSPLEHEINILDTYLKLEQIRFGFSYKITVQDGLNRNEIEVPVLIFQPMVENAVKHGVSALKEKGEIIVHFYAEKKKLICTITDNGDGYSQEHQQYGYGFKLTNDRIKLINEMTNYKAIGLSIDSKDGTVIKFIFNDWI